MVVDTVGSGRVIGWSALAEPYVYTAGARALAGTMALAFDGRGLRALMERDVDVGSKVNKRLIQMLGRRLMQVYGVLDSLL